MLTRHSGFRLVRRVALALLACAPLGPIQAGEVRLEQSEFRVQGRRIVVRGAGYSPLPIGAAAGDPLPPCVYARDLPLLASLGANTVRTFNPLPEGDSTFLPLLETTGLYWLAGFPLDAWYDPSRTLASRQNEILDAFRRYALRFRGERRLIGYVLGEQIAENYGLRWAGPASEFDSLLEEAARLLSEVEPEDTPLLATSTLELAELRRAPPGLSFWLWNVGPRRTLANAIDEALQISARPLLIDGYSAAASDEAGVQAQSVAEITRSIFASPALLGGIFAAYLDDYRNPQGTGLFHPAASTAAGLDHVVPNAAFGIVAGLWEGHEPLAWQLEGKPRLSQVIHAASGDEALAPGTLARLGGDSLEKNLYAANGIPWAFHLGETCLCVGGQAAPLGMVAPETGTALIPWDLPTGDQPAVFFRAGLATNLLTVPVRAYAPGIFPGAVVRAGTFCRATPENGVRPGELLEVYASGLGPGAPSWMTPEVTVNQLPAEVLYSGTLPNFVGLQQVNVRVNPSTPPGSNVALVMRSGDAAAPPYRLSVAGPEDRYGVALAAPAAEVVVQAGGEGRVAEFQVEGRSGYCGPVLLSADVPLGLSFRAPVGFTGDVLPVEIRASASAAPMKSAAVVFRGYAPGTSSGNAAVHVTVLAGLGDIRVRVISGGFRAQPLARFDWNDRTLFSTAGGGAGRGISVLAVDAATGVFGPVRSFDTWGDETAADRLVASLQGLPAGTVVLFAVADDGSLLLPPAARAAIAAMFGSKWIESLAYQQAWSMIARKGASIPLAEGLSSETQVLLERVLTFPQP